jgi:hypothetical protein
MEPSMTMENWQLFTDPKFKVRFKYPVSTPQNHNVETLTGQSDDSIRVHLISRDSQEVYFEVTRYFTLSVHGEYRTHKAYLEQRFEAEGFSITELTDHKLGESPAHQYSFRWDNKQRVAILVQQGQVTYRILYDPQSNINAQILSTIEFIA